MPLPITSLLHLDLHLWDQTHKLPRTRKTKTDRPDGHQPRRQCGSAVSFLSTENIHAANY